MNRNKYLRVDMLRSPTGNDNQTIDVPNQGTLDAIAETLSGNCMVFENEEDFFEDLDD